MNMSSGLRDITLVQLINKYTCVSNEAMNDHTPTYAQICIEISLCRKKTDIYQNMC